MARPREFEETVVLDAAMNRFWAHGYELTSVRDLAASMGITGASLYNAFGDKRSLYRRALSHYVERSVRDRIVRLSELPPLPAVQAFFDEIIERSVGDAECRGCMLVNAFIEMTPGDKEFRAAVAQEVSAIKLFFHRCVTAGQKNRTITRSQSAEAVAGLLLSTLLGLRVMARTHRERDALAAPVNAVIGLLTQPRLAVKAGTIRAVGAVSPSPPIPRRTPSNLD